MRFGESALLCCLSLMGIVGVVVLGVVVFVSVAVVMVVFLVSA